jgi:hypothetical protein
VSDRCPSCGLSPYERGIGDSDISRIVAERNVLAARLKAAEQVVAAARDLCDMTSTAKWIPKFQKLQDSVAALARQPSQERA